MNVNMLNNRAILFAASLMLLVPLVAMPLTDEVGWSLADFVVAWALLAGAGFTFKALALKSGNLVYKAGAGITVLTALTLVWANLAVGIISDEQNPANLMYCGVLAVLVGGVIIGRFSPRGMSWALLMTAMAQLAVAAIAQFAGWGVPYLVNAVFIVLWIVAGLLFLRAGHMAE